MIHLTQWLLIGCGATLLAGAVLVRAQAPVPAQPASATIDFTRDIQPILDKHCAMCHGRSLARGNLRLHAPDYIRKGGQSGLAVVPGKSHESLLIRRVLGLDDQDRMPFGGEPLPDATITMLRAWIDQGAAISGEAPAATAIPSTGARDALSEVEGHEQHWAYVKPARPELPAVNAAGWIRSPIDRFVLARLEREQLSPAAEAAKATLLRRVTLDLIGLPPAPGDLAAFLADTSPDAYDKVVDRLLASPHYGERWAQPWLDLARYADSNGYEKDNRRDIWKYRDWVIDALNRDVPFDRFTTEQIAGDMLPDATTEQKIASGFHRNAMTNEEGGVDPDESMYETLVDRVNTTATVWLGSTLACAQCHNHKYDPFSQKDYFRLLAFFANGDYETRVRSDGTRYVEPTLDLATPEQEAARKKLQAEIDRLNEELRAVTPAVRDAQAEWERSLRSARDGWHTLTPLKAVATNGTVLKVLPDGSVLAAGANPRLTSYTVTALTTVHDITGLRIEALPDPSLPKGGPGRDGYGHFRITGIAVEAAPTVGNTRDARAVGFETIEVDESATTFEPEDLLANGDGGHGRKRGSWAINAMRDAERLPRQAVLAAATPFGFAEGTSITVRIDHLEGTIGQGLGRFRVSVTNAPKPLEGATLAPRVRRALDVPVAERTAAQTEDLHAAFRANGALLKPTRDALAAARKELAGLQIPSTLVMRDRPSFERPSYELRARGSFAAKGERVYARTPAALHPMRDDQPMNRLGLARWLVDEENPLVARVAVNRLWEQIFGRGLVETSEDFGTQGAKPTHPELLDWLATEFMANGWSQKTLIRTIVRSSTYRQSSAATRELAEKDPYNRLFARGPRLRMSAEMIRDSALASSGLLSRKTFGPSVFPSQPDGIWNIPYNTDTWTTSSGEDRYRRSLYTFWRRTSPYPSFMTFDATSREYCTVRRVRTNTPLQALTLLNDPAFFEAARALAGRMMAAAGDARTRVALGVKLVLAREAAPAETDRLVAMYEQELAHYRRHAPTSASNGNGTAHADPADLAAWTMVANVLLNLDEALTKE